MLTKDEFIKRSVLLFEKKLDRAIPEDEPYLTEQDMWDILCETVLKWTGLIK